LKKSAAHIVTLKAWREEIRNHARPNKAAFFQKFFKTGPGEYAEGDQFLGLSVPQMRSIAKKSKGLNIKETLQLLQSKLHEERLIALILMVEKFRSGDDKVKNEIFKAYLKNRTWVNNWDLVDSSAPQIVGAYLENRDRSLLRKLARSKSLWDRRIAIVSTQYLIRKGEFKDTTEISEMLLKDSEDLIHKASGWMLREVGKRDEKVLKKFLKNHAAHMPRTMLRYSIEKFTPAERAKFMQMKMDLGYSGTGNRGKIGKLPI
jgi:3-methyladenine DNA glycosylase AlkD